MKIREYSECLSGSTPRFLSTSLHWNLTRESLRWLESTCGSSASSAVFDHAVRSVICAARRGRGPGANGLLCAESRLCGAWPLERCARDREVKVLPDGLTVLPAPPGLKSGATGNARCVLAMKSGPPRRPLSISRPQLQTTANFQGRSGVGRGRTLVVCMSPADGAGAAVFRGPSRWCAKCCSAPPPPRPDPPNRAKRFPESSFWLAPHPCPCHSHDHLTSKCRQ